MATRPYGAAGGVVFYANYLKYFERARTEWLRQMGVSQSVLQADLDCIFIMAEVTLRYLASAKLDDLLSITLSMTDIGRASMHLEQQAWRGDKLLAQATVRIGCVNASDLRPRRIPQMIQQLLQKTA
jgi:acyl-CoA thioester hydrolase